MSDFFKVVISIALVCSFIGGLVCWDNYNEQMSRDRCHAKGGEFFENNSKDYCLKPDSIIFID